MTVSYLLLILLLIFLILVSAFFSASETGVMALNRYRMAHAARKGDLAAKRVMSLLARPDRLLAVILIGNTFANILASAVTTVIAVHFFGKAGVLAGTAVLILMVLIFGESTPKTLAASYPEQVARPASAVLKVLLKIFYPLVWFINMIGNGLLRMCGIHRQNTRAESLSLDELKTLLDENQSKVSSDYKKMLLRILDLEQITVEEIMVPRSEIFGIDLEETWEHILQQLFECPYSFVPLYKEDINHALGMLNLRRVLIVLQQKSLNKEELIALAEEIYFIPLEATANQQLLNFRHQKHTIGMVVDEYGDIQGLVTLQNILEEIVGEFTHDIESNRAMAIQKDGSYLIDAGLEIRTVNEIMQWHFPTDGPRTLSGLIVEYLEAIPRAGICVRLGGYPLEIVRVGQNTIKRVRVWPQLYVEPLVMEDL